MATNDHKNAMDVSSPATKKKPRLDPPNPPFDDVDGKTLILANLTIITEVIAADINDCKSKVSDLEKEVSVLKRENGDLKWWWWRWSDINGAGI